MNRWQYTIEDMDGDALEGWPEDILAEHDAAIEAFEDGDLAPLAAYLNRGRVVTYQIAARLCFALNNYPPVKLSLHRITPGRQPHSDNQTAYYRRQQLGIEAEQCLRQNPGRNAKWARAEVVKRRKAGGETVGESTVRKAHQELQRFLAGDMSGSYFHDTFEIDKAFPGYWEKWPPKT